MTEKKEKSLFHIVPITKGEYGYLSKVQEELEEALDAEKQENGAPKTVSQILADCAKQFERPSSRYANRTYADRTYATGYNR